MKAQKDQDLADKLDQLIILMAAQAVANLETMGEKIRYLGKIGLNRNQIALACGTTPGTVSVQLSKAKAKERKKGKSDDEGQSNK